MAMNPGATKRQKELARKQRQQEKKERQLDVAPGEDPDIAGIVPGPQPLPLFDE